MPAERRIAVSADDAARFACNALSIGGRVFLNAASPGLRAALAYLRIAVAGASGRMGHMLIEAVLAAPDLQLAGALDIAGSPALGQDAGAFAGRPTGVAITSSLHDGLANAQVLIDFTRPEGTLAHLAVCRELGVGLVMMLLLHGFITSNVPMGVPIEWNLMVVYGGFALFYAHPGLSLADVGPPPLAAAPRRTTRPT